MIGEVLAAVEASHAAKLEASEARLEELRREGSKCDAAVEAAEILRRDQAQEVSISQQSLQQAKDEAGKAQSERSAALAEQTDADAKHSELEGNKALAESIVSTQLQALKDGTADDKQTTMNTVAKLGQDLALEAQLLVSGAVALCRAPTDRTSFDTLVVGQVDEHFGAALKKLVEQVAATAECKTDRAENASGCTQKHELAVANVHACTKRLEAAADALKEKEEGKRATEAAAAKAGLDIRQAGAAVDEAQAPLAACKAVVATFQELVEPATMTEADSASTAAAEAAPPAAATADPVAEGLASEKAMASLDLGATVVAVAGA